MWSIKVKFEIVYFYIYYVVYGDICIIHYQILCRYFPCSLLLQTASPLAEFGSFSVKDSAVNSTIHLCQYLDGYGDKVRSIRPAALVWYTGEFVSCYYVTSHYAEISVCLLLYYINYSYQVYVYIYLQKLGN